MESKLNAKTTNFLPLCMCKRNTICFECKSFDLLNDCARIIKILFSIPTRRIIYTRHRHDAVLDVSRFIGFS